MECQGRLLIYLGIGPSGSCESSMNILRWVLAWCVFGVSNVTDDLRLQMLVSALDLVTSSVQVEGSILTAGKRLSLKNLNVIIRAIN